ncbi:MAG: APC family permease [SAR324 cluster bacterium]|nr:APC family permease [SAR324 cluster bacterium]
MALTRTLGLTGGIAMVVTLVIGSGIFSLPALAIEASGSITAFLSWLFLSLVIPLLIIVMASLGKKYPQTEGIYLYATMATGQWSKGGVLLLLCSCYFVGSPALYLVAGSYIADFLDAPQFTLEVSILVIILSHTINLWGIKFLGFLNSILVWLVIILIGIIVVISWQFIDWTLINANLADYSFRFDQFWQASAILFWAFLGFENMSFSFGEIKNPHRMIPRIYTAGYLIITVIYLSLAATLSLINLSGFKISGISGLSEILATNIAHPVLLSTLIFVLIASANAWTYSISRVYYSAAISKLLPNFVSYTTKSANKNPIGAIIFSAAINILILLIMKYMKLDPKYYFLLTSQGFLILMTLAVITYLKYAKRNVERLVGVLSLLIMIFFLQGFTLLLLYPLAFFMLGTIIFNRHKIVSYLIKKSS